MLYQHHTGTIICRITKKDLSNKIVFPLFKVGLNNYYQLILWTQKLNCMNCKLIKL